MAGRISPMEAEAKGQGDAEWMLRPIGAHVFCCLLILGVLTADGEQSCPVLPIKQVQGFSFAGLALFYQFCRFHRNQSSRW